MALIGNTRFTQNVIKVGDLTGILRRHNHDKIEVMQGNLQAAVIYVADQTWVVIKEVSLLSDTTPKGVVKAICSQGWAVLSDDGGTEIRPRFSFEPIWDRTTGLNETPDVIVEALAGQGYRLVSPKGTVVLQLYNPNAPENPGLTADYLVVNVTGLNYEQPPRSGRGCATAMLLPLGVGFLKLLSFLHT